jgi:hypothetical protein
MPATYVTEAELRSALGIGNLYTSAVVEDACQAAENIVKAKLNFNRTPILAHSNTATTGTIYFQYPHTFYLGQTITIEGAGAKFNGSKTITEAGEYSVTFAITGNNNTPTVKHDIVPYGYAYGDTYTDYALLDEVREASLMIAVDIWQARQSSNAGGISPDFQPSPYRMGNTLMARVRGLLADHLAPGGQVG